jgi:hypothetical protein
MVRTAFRDKEIIALLLSSLSNYPSCPFARAARPSSLDWMREKLRAQPMRYAGFLCERKIWIANLNQNQKGAKL